MVEGLRLQGHDPQDPHGVSASSSQWAKVGDRDDRAGALRPSPRCQLGPHSQAYRVGLRQAEGAEQKQGRKKVRFRGLGTGLCLRPVRVGVVFCPFLGLGFPVCTVTGGPVSQAYVASDVLPALIVPVAFPSSLWWERGWGRAQRPMGLHSTELPSPSSRLRGSKEARGTSLLRSRP